MTNVVINWITNSPEKTTFKLLSQGDYFVCGDFGSIFVKTGSGKAINLAKSGTFANEIYVHSDEVVINVRILTIEATLRYKGK